MNNIEIERKWLMDGFPPLPLQHSVFSEQGYLSFKPTVRIRKTLRAGIWLYYLTIKGEGTLARTEVELPLQAEQYDALLPLLAAPTATKKMQLHTLPGGETLECSLVDEGAPTAFYYAEVEFETIEQARAFQPPPYFGREVTEVPGFTMAAYCLRKK